MSGGRRLRIMSPASLSPGGAERQMLLLAEHLPRDRFEVSFVLLGAITEKGQICVTEAMTMARQHLPDAWLAFVGSGPERATVERSARMAGLERARFARHVPDARVLYAGFDVVVSASDAEGLPNALLEAAAAGRPIAATAAGGTPEIDTDGDTGVLVAVGDTGGLGRAITRVLDDPGPAQRLGHAARQHVATAFGLERFVAETAALCEEMDRRHGS